MKKSELKKRIALLEKMRPHWAQGYSSDGVAAQATCVALNQLWELLDVDNQTAAVAKLEKIIHITGVPAK